MGNEKRQQNPRRPPQRTRLHPPGQSRMSLLKAVYIPRKKNGFVQAKAVVFTLQLFR